MSTHRPATFDGPLVRCASPSCDSLVPPGAVLCSLCRRQAQPKEPEEPAESKASRDRRRSALYDDVRVPSPPARDTMAAMRRHP